MPGTTGLSRVIHRAAKDPWAHRPATGPSPTDRRDNPSPPPPSAVVLPRSCWPRSAQTGSPRLTYSASARILGEPRPPLAHPIVEHLRVGRQRIELRDCA